MMRRCFECPGTVGDWQHFFYHRPVNGARRKTLGALFNDPVGGNFEWRRIESLLKALGCAVVEGAGSSVLFKRNGIKLKFHRPHPARQALRYRDRDARAFLLAIGVTP